MSVSDRRLLIFSAAVFFLIKASVILSQTMAMGMPRLGDDGLLLLWRGEQINRVGVARTMQNIDAQSPKALRDIVELCPEQESYELSENQKLCERAAVRFARPHFVMGANLLAAAIMRLELPWKWSFAVYELVILAAISAAFAYFLHRIVGPAAGGIGMLLMASVAIPSAQGIHQFIPSTLIISLSLALWAWVLGSAWSIKRNSIAVGLVGLMTWVHPIALLFGGGGVVATAFLNRSRLSVKGVLTATALGIGALAVLLFFNAAIRGVIATELSQNLDANLSRNIAAVPGFVRRFANLNPAFLAALILPLICFRRVFDERGNAAGLGLLVLIVLSLVHITSSYRFTFTLDVTSRFFVAACVLLAGLVGQALMTVRDRSMPWKAGAFAVVAAVMATGLSSSWQMIYRNMNSRLEVVSKSGIQKGIQKLGEASSIAYGEIDITLPTVLLSGGDAYGAIPVPGLGKERFTTAVENRRPEAISVPNFRQLNSIGIHKQKTFETRKLGFHGRLINQLYVSVPFSAVETVYLKVHNIIGKDITIGPNFIFQGNRPPLQIGPVAVPRGKQKWIAVDLREATGLVQLGLPNENFWITGISVNSLPAKDVSWPWAWGARVNWHRRGDPLDKVVGASFTIHDLFQHWDAPKHLLALVRTADPILSDEGGIVFVATRYKSQK